MPYPIFLLITDCYTCNTEHLININHIFRMEEGKDSSDNVITIILMDNGKAFHVKGYMKDLYLKIETEIRERMK